MVVPCLGMSSKNSIAYIINSHHSAFVKQNQFLKILSLNRNQVIVKDLNVDTQSLDIQKILMKINQRKRLKLRNHLI